MTIIKFAKIRNLNDVTKFLYYNTFFMIGRFMANPL